MDPLEDRALPSTLTVTSTGDQGSGTLRVTLATARDGDSIVFAPQVQGRTIRLTRGPLVVGASVAIGEAGAQGVTISAGGRSGDFVIDRGVQATFQSLTITGGKAVQGGGIENLGGLTLTGCTFRGNRAIRGGAIFNEGPAPAAGAAWNAATQTAGTLSAVQCLFSGNAAAAGRGQRASGGAIESVDGDLRVTASTFTGNRATGGQGGGVGIGGAIAALSSVMDISASTFSQNAAIGGQGGGDGIGGAIDIEGSPSQVSQGVANQTTLSDNVYDANRAGGGKGGTGGDGLGGAIRVANDLTSTSVGVLINLSQFTGNRATGGSGAIGGDGDGGAIKLGSSSGTDLTIAMRLDGNTYTGNQAMGGNGTKQGGDGKGGAVDLLADNPIAAGSTPGLARVVDAIKGTPVTASNSSGRGNTAVGGSGGGGGEGGVFHLGFGGGSLSLGDDQPGGNSPFDSEYIGNSAVGGRGISAITGTAAGGSGGAVLLDGGTVLLRNVEITGNVAMGTKKTLSGGHGGGLALLNGSSIEPGSTVQEVNGNQAQDPSQELFEQG